MQIELIGIVTLLIGIATVWRGPAAVAATLACAAVLGASAALIVFGGTIQPAHLLLAFLAASLVAQPSLLKRVAYALCPPRPGFWLCALVAYGVLGALIVPRLLAGEVMIFPIGQTQSGATYNATPLTPTSGNLTQSVYMIANVLVFASVAAICASERGLRTVIVGVLAFCVANVVFALLDVVTHYTGLSFVLEPIRNATYVMHTETETGAMKRIVGSFPEASTFARATLGAFAFAGTLWLCRRGDVFVGMIALFSLVLVALSTAATGLAGLPLVVILLYCTALTLAISRKRMRAAMALIVAPLFLAGGGALFILAPDAAAGVGGYVENTLLNKLGSASGVERTAWNSAGLQAAIDTWGLGVGLGTTRTSSFLVAVLASCGVIGVLLYTLFFAHVAFSAPTGGAYRRDLCQAARNACLALLLGDLLIATTVDQGVLFYVLAAIATAKPAFGER